MVPYLERALFFMNFLQIGNTNIMMRETIVRKVGKGVHSKVFKALIRTEIFMTNNNFIKSESR